MAQAARTALLLAVCAIAMPACKRTPYRFDVIPLPLGTSCLIRAGFHGDQASWACIDHAHDEYLAQWQAVVQREMTGITSAIRSRSNALDVDLEGSWLKDVDFMEQLRRRHAALLTQLTALDQNLFSQWGACLGEAHAAMIEDLAMDRAIARAKSVSSPGERAFIDLREVLSELKLPPEQRAPFEERMRAYAHELLPAAEQFAAAHVRRPIDGNDEAVNKAADRIAAINLRTLESLQGVGDADIVDRLKIGFVNQDSWRPTEWQKVAPLLIIRLPNLEQAQRVEIARIVHDWEQEDRAIALRIAAAMARGKDDPRAKLARDARQELMKQRNLAMIKVAEKQYPGQLSSLYKQSGNQLRSTIAALLPGSDVGEVLAALPQPPPDAAPDGWPIRKSAETFALFLPPDFGPWVESRLRPLQPRKETDGAVSATVLADGVESWNKTFQEHFRRIKDAEDRMKEASSSDISVPEAQRRLRTLVTEVDAARNELTQVEDQTIAELAAVLSMDPNDPRIERLRIERAVTAANIDWRQIPMGSLLAIDREATIDVPAAFAQARLSPEAGAITDAAIIDAAVPLVETSDRLRVATIDALRSFVLNMKKMIMEFKFDDKDQAAGEAKLREVLASAARGVEPAARARVEVQQEILKGTCSSLNADDARELKRAYWQYAFPDLFYDRHPADDLFDQMLAEMPQDDRRNQAEQLAQTRQAALDELLARMIEARKLWANDNFQISKDNFAQMQRRAPALAILLTVRDEINTRALREAAMLEDPGSDAWIRLSRWVDAPWIHSSE
jgi:hypothetical protein